MTTPTPPGRVAHLAAKGSLAQAVMFDVPAVAICGRVWHPNLELVPTWDDLCPACWDRVEGTPLEAVYRAALEGLEGSEVPAAPLDWDRRPCHECGHYVGVHPTSVKGCAACERESRSCSQDGTTAARAPKRIQRRRTMGWRMPAGAVYVGRGTEWGNPWKVGDHVLLEWPYPAQNAQARELMITAALAVELYRIAFTPDAAEARAELRGRDLACWCPLDQPCHADVLLELANGGDRP